MKNNLNIINKILLNTKYLNQKLKHDKYLFHDILAITINNNFIIKYINLRNIAVNLI